MNQSLAGELDQAVPIVNVTGLPDSLCTIQSRPGGSTPNVSPAGQVILTPSEFTDIPGLVNIPCLIAVQSPLRPDQSAVMRMPEGFDVFSQRHIWLAGYFPQIAKENQAVVDGIPYQIDAVESDSQRRTTRLAVRQYSK